MPAIIGAGITGCTLARALAEIGYRVHVYEAADHVGGLAHARNLAFMISNSQVRQFLYGRMSYRRIDGDLCVPLIDWKRACEELLAHTSINYLTCAPIRGLKYITEHYDRVYSTLSPDKLFNEKDGVLSYAADETPVRSPTDLVLYAQYLRRLEQMGVLSLGYYGSYQRLSIESCVMQALLVAGMSFEEIDTAVEIEQVGHGAKAIEREDTRLIAAPKEVRWATHQ